MGHAEKSTVYLLTYSPIAKPLTLTYCLHNFVVNTIDWVQDAVRERYRQNSRTSEAGHSWTAYLWESYEAGQAWLVVSLVGTGTSANLFSTILCVPHLR